MLGKPIAETIRTYLQEKKACLQTLAAPAAMCVNVCTSFCSESQWMQSIARFDRSFDIAPTHRFRIMNQMTISAPPRVGDWMHNMKTEHVLIRGAAKPNIISVNSFVVPTCCFLFLNLLKTGLDPACDGKPTSRIDCIWLDNCRVFQRHWENTKKQLMVLTYVIIKRPVIL